jgi:hypothetical protein
MTLALLTGCVAGYAAVPMDLVVQAQVRACLRSTGTQASLSVSEDTVSFRPEVTEDTLIGACLRQKGFAYLGYRTVGAINLFGLPPHHWWQRSEWWPACR